MTLSSIFEQVAGKPVEDRTYNIGEISQKTGLMKTANGWVEPPKGKAAPKGNVPGNKPLNNQYYKNDVRTEEGSKKILSETKTEAIKSRIDELESLKKKNGGNLGEGGEKELQMKKEELSKRSGGEGNTESNASGMSAEQRKKWADKAANSSETKASLTNFIKSMEGNKVNPHAEEIVKIYKDELKKREENPRYRPEKIFTDGAPRALTGDCKVRIRK